MTWLIAELEAVGYRLTVVGEKIRLDFEGEEEPDKERVVDLIDQLRQHKGEALAHLSRQAGALEERIGFARSEDELEDLVEEIQAGFEAGHLSMDQSDHLTWLVIVTARQLAQGLPEVAEEERLGDLLRRQPAVQVYSRSLDEDVLWAADDAQVPEDNQVVVYRESELHQVVGRTSAQVQAIHAVKVVFDGQVVGDDG